MKQESLKIKTEKFFQIIDITNKVQSFVTKNNITEGLINVFSRHTTVAIKINENEAGFFKDLKHSLFFNFTKLKRPYLHNDTHIRNPETICNISSGQDCLNGHSHVAQMLLGSASETIPVKDGKLMLGEWQRILFLELDYARDREILISAL